LISFPHGLPVGLTFGPRRGGNVNFLILYCRLAIKCELFSYIKNDKAYSCLRVGLGRTNFKKIANKKSSAAWMGLVGLGQQFFHIMQSWCV
jgi:hypothetical protein